MDQGHVSVAHSSFGVFYVDSSSHLGASRVVKIHDASIEMVCFHARR